MSDKQVTIIMGYARPQVLGLDDASNKVYPGWQPLIKRLFDDLFALGWDGQITQIKEKFGLLRLYLTTSANSEMRERVRAAEEESGSTCRVCGQPGELRYGGWIKVLCDEHFKMGTH